MGEGHDPPVRRRSSSGLCELRRYVRADSDEVWIESLDGGLFSASTLPDVATTAVCSRNVAGRGRTLVATVSRSANVSGEHSHRDHGRFRSTCRSSLARLRTRGAPRWTALLPLAQTASLRRRLMELEARRHCSASERRKKSSPGPRKPGPQVQRRRGIRTLL